MTQSRMSVFIAVVALTLLSCRAHAEDRVAAARKNQQGEIKALFEKAKLAYPAKEVFLRAFKDEGELELWAGPGKGKALTLVTTFSVCAKSGELGPKRELGDLQVPEGFYKLDRFNPWSNFHLSLGINYPNDSDRLLGRKGKLGGDIFIHGSCVTIGCLPIEDDFIEKLYVIALDAKAAGAREVPVHIFPKRLSREGLAELEQKAGDNKALYEFWLGLQRGYDAFEQTRRPPRVSVNPKTGAYIVAPQS